MKKQLISLNLLIFGLVSLFIPSAHAQSCVTGNTRSTAYIQREGDKRCEGVQPIDIGGSFLLISLTIGRITTLDDFLKLEVPKSNNQEPKVRVRSLQKNYQLDPIALRPNGSRYQFQWSNFVLDEADIDPQSLRATAFVNIGKLVYVPVIFSRSAKKYDMVLFSNVRAKITEFQIVQKDKVIYTTSRPDFQPKGQIPFTWNGRTPDNKIAPAGLYELRVKALLEQDDAPPRSASINLTFEHDPQWLQ